MSVELLPITEDHSEAIVAIMNRHTAEGFASFWDTVLPAAAVSRILASAGGRPNAVVVDDGTVLGFGFLLPYHHPSPVFRTTAEIGYFFHPDHIGRGLGTTLLEHLLARAPEAGIERVIAEISSFNEPSLAFHKRRGFVECGRFPNIGRKFGRAFDIVWMIRELGT